PATFLLAHQKRDQVNELFLHEAFLQTFRHGTQGGRPLLLNLGLRQEVLLSLVISQRERLLGFRDLDAGQRLAVLERDHQCPETRRDRAARLQYGLHNVDAREAAPDTRQFRPDALALIAETVALQTLRFFRIEKYLAAALRVAPARQGRLCQP